MDFDYNKIVDFLLDYDFNKKGLSDVLKEVMSSYIMLDVNVNAYMILLKSKVNGLEYILTRRNSGLIIMPKNANLIGITETFGEIVEIRVNDDDCVVLSNIVESANPKGIYASTSIWHNEEGGTFTQSVGRLIFFDMDNLMSLDNKETIDMFIKISDTRRNEIYNDLYWDMDNLSKRAFIDIKLTKRIQINNGYDKKKFNELYPVWINKIKEELPNNPLPKIF